MASGGSGASAAASGANSPTSGAGASGSPSTDASGSADAAAAGAGGGGAGATGFSGASGSAGAAGSGSGGNTGSSGGNGSTGSTGASGSSTGSSGGSGSSTGSSGSSVVTPPVRDTASTIPLSSAPGYTVEGNYPYGPLKAQRLDVIYPPSAGPKGTQVLPAVMMFHGGGWIHGWKEANGKDHMSTFFDRFLAHGFMVCNAEYRVNDNTADGAVAPAAVEDALLAAKWCWDNLDYFHGDKTRYVVTGASAGGHLALMVGMTTPAAALGPTSPTAFTIAGIVDGYGPADIQAELNGVASGWIPASLPNRAAVAALVNPMTYVRKDIPPLIVVQGSNDHTAPVGDSVRLVNMLTAAGANATMHEVPGAGHGFLTTAEWADAEKAMFDWLVARGIGK